MSFKILIIDRWKGFFADGNVSRLRHIDETLYNFGDPDKVKKKKNKMLMSNEPKVILYRRRQNYQGSYVLKG